MATTIDLTGNDDELEETLGPHDPRRRALRGGRKTERSEDTRAAITALHKANPDLNNTEIAEKVGCSRQFVHRVLSTKPRKARIPAPLLRKMVAALSAGADPAELLDRIPEVAGLFKSQTKRKAQTDERERVLASLRVLISSGKNETEGPAFELYQARQAGKLK